MASTANQRDSKLEMVLVMDFYLQHNSSAKGNSNARRSKNIPKTCSAISEFHEGQVLTPGTIATIFKEEALQCLKPNTEMSLWQVQRVAFILGTPLSCIYPLYGGYTTRPDLNCCLDVHQSLLRPSQQGSCGPTPRERTSAEWQWRIGAQTTLCHASLTPVI
jgi:hypothetical protein